MKSQDFPAGKAGKQGEKAGKLGKLALRAGDSFRIVAPKGGLAKRYEGESYVCRKVVRQKIKGYDDSLDLGQLVVFVGAVDQKGKPVLHALPLEWCRKVARRVE